jgi:hypothetical protein
MKTGLKQIEETGTVRMLLASSVLAIIFFATSAQSADIALPVNEPGRPIGGQRADSTGRGPLGQLFRSVVRFQRAHVHLQPQARRLAESPLSLAGGKVIPPLGGKAAE